MDTAIIRPTTEGIRNAACIIKNGGLVALPTETVYGLGADALNEHAVKKIFIAKGRPSDNPVIVHIAEKSDILKLAKDIPDSVFKLTDKFWPGPLTVILRKKTVIPDTVSAGLDSVAIRLPDNRITRDIIKFAGVPIAAPSANVSGKPSPTSAVHVFNDLNGKIEAIVDGGSCKIGVESTVITFLSETPEILRPGFVSPEEVKSIVPDIKINRAVYSEIIQEKVLSPGLKYKHYAPRIKVVLVKGSNKSYIDFVNSKPKRKCLALCFEDIREYINLDSVSLGFQDDELNVSNRVFAALRELDSFKYGEIVYAQCPSMKGASLAVYNRLIRAAGFEVINLE